MRISADSFSIYLLKLLTYNFRITANSNIQSKIPGAKVRISEQKN